MGDNKFKYFLFDPAYVGWGKGLIKSIEDAKSLNVPLAVKSKEHLDKVKRKYPKARVIIID